MSISIYPSIVYEQDLSPDFSGEEIDGACKEIYEACKGRGTDEVRLIAAMAKTPEQRHKISLRYKEIYDKDLKALMKKECSGDFGTALELLALPADVAEARLVKLSTAGMGTNETLLYSVLCGRSNVEIDMLKKAYFKQYDKDLTKLVASEVGGSFEDLLLLSAQGVEEAYDPQHHTDDKAKADAKSIYDAGQGRMGTNEMKIFKIIAMAPPKYLDSINREYVDKYGYTLSKALEKELKGDVEKAALFTLGMKLKPYETMAALIKSACAGMGTNELLLTSCIIRFQPVMTKVMVAHTELYGKSVHDRVMDECKGDYEKLLIAVLACGA